MTLILSALFLIAGCGKRIAQESVLDTPQMHYTQGKRLLEAGRLDDALREFERAKGLNPNYAPAYEGIGLVALERQDLRAAEQSMKQARDKDEQYAPAYVGLGRVYSAMGHYEDAVEQFRMALKKDPKSGDAHYYWGRAAVAVRAYDTAEVEFEAALNLNPLDARANAAWKEVNEIRRAGAGVSQEYGEIAKKPGITRADFAVILTSELPLDRLFKDRQVKPAGGFRPPGMTEAGEPTLQIPSDVQPHWARVAIERVLTLGVMESLPDGSFGPNEPVNRADFAMLLQQFLVTYLNDPSLPTRFIGSPSPFPDVPGAHYAFNAVQVATSRGILSAAMDGTFGLMKQVSGADALLSIRKLKEQLK